MQCSRITSDVLPRNQDTRTLMYGFTKHICHCRKGWLKSFDPFEILDPSTASQFYSQRVSGVTVRNDGTLQMGECATKMRSLSTGIIGHSEKDSA